MRRVSLLASCLITCCGALGAQEGAALSSAWDEVAAEWRQLVEDQGIVGSSLMFLHDGRVIEQAFHGHADLATGRQVDARTIYHWASITKTFTGIAVLQLRDRGLLSLDDPILKHLPELKAIHDPNGWLERVTLRHLLSHSSGFRSPTWPWSDQDWHPHEPTEWSQLVTMLPYTTLHFEPGSRFHYSNLGIIFLGRVIEQRSGDDYEVYVHKNVLTPLGMHDTYFDHTPYHLLPHRSNNYTVKDGQRTANGLDFDTGITVSNGGLNAPLTDMARYLTFLIGGGDERAQAVLDRDSLESMWVPLVPAGEADGLKTSLGLTWFVLEDGRARYVGHTGGQKAFLSFVYFHPETRIAVLAAFNTQGVGDAPRPDTRAVLAKVRAAVFERLFPLFADH